MKFLKNVFKEMKQVSFISFKELFKLTVTVAVSIIVFAIFFGVIDLGLTAALKLLLSL